jgi:hypothetical protein
MDGRIKPYGRATLKKIALAAAFNLVYEPADDLPTLRPKPVHVLSEMEFENAMYLGEDLKKWRY